MTTTLVCGLICSACASDDQSPDAAAEDHDAASVEDAAVDAASDAADPADAASDASTDDADATDEPEELCSGCSDENQDAADMSIHLHHVHMNVSDRAKSEAFYKEHFGATPVVLNGELAALRAAPMLLLFEETEAPGGALPTALQHIGWGAVDPFAWYETAHASGVEPDLRGHSLFANAETPTPAGTGEAFRMLLGTDFPECFTINEQIAYIYVLGPDDERIELWSGDDDRVNHMHFTSADLPSALSWYQDFLDIDPGTGSFFLDGTLFFFETDGVAADYEPTDSHVLGHIAFSVTDIAAWRARAEAQGIEIVSEPAETHGFQSFFVRGPDGLLIELVQASPLPDLCE